MCCKEVKLWKVPAGVGSIMVAGVLICCALIDCDLKASQMNAQHSLIPELML